ncbi:hypothetical protein [Vibrio panuliri]|uniref:Uncharacterized protein n=1 Tax=Vibrio panuliri TaxID=1381081 RepID=A0ABX3FPB5_9VIBR|nr:hypothetical protein [Vibrio panuliri]KAB1457189.1 hypothetical protein F7O85_05400 [Vibrio panuliri]OLQ94588.1 hypothetical protein BIY20_21615 [Vibrio panuliri]
MGNEANWKQLIFGALIGAVITGVSQYLLLQSSHSNELKKAKIDAKRTLLTNELNERKSAYEVIRLDFVRFYQSQNREDLKELQLSLRGRVPFFQPKYRTQLSVDSAIKSAELWILQTNRKKIDQSLEELEKSFQADIDRIQTQIDEL